MGRGSADDGGVPHADGAADAERRSSRREHCLPCARAELLELARRRAFAGRGEDRPAPDGRWRHGRAARSRHRAAGARTDAARRRGRGRLLLRGRPRRLPAASAPARERRRQPRRRADEHPGLSTKPAGEDGSARRAGPAARAGGASSRRPSGLQRRPRAEPGGGGRQAPAPRARASRAGADPHREPDRGAAGHPRDPQAPVPAFLGGRPRDAAHGRQAGTCRGICARSSTA